VHSTQPVEIFGILRNSVPWPSFDNQVNFTEITQGNPSVGGEGLNARGVAKYTDFGQVGMREGMTLRVISVSVGVRYRLI